MSELELEQNGSKQKGVTASSMLSSAREAMGLSQKEVADQLYLTIAFIKYIDEGQFEKIPKPAFIKGYLRSYARTVELSGDEVVACYEDAVQAADESAQIRNVTEETVGTVAITGPVFQTGLVGLFGVVVVVGMVWWIASSGKENDEHIPQVTSPQLVQDTAVVNGRVVSGGVGSSEDDLSEVDTNEIEMGRGDFDFVLQDNQAGEVAGDEEDLSGGSTAGAGTNKIDSDRSTKVNPEASGTTSDSAVESSTRQKFGDQLDSSSGPIENNISIERNSDAGIDYITVNANGFDEVEAEFFDDCWLEVEDGNGDSIYGDLNKSGEVLRIYGVAPFKLLIGKATALKLRFNGDDIDLAVYTAVDETAKVTLTRRP